MDLDARIDAANEEFISEEVETPSPVDAYQAQADIRRQYSQKSYPYGARSLVLSTVEDVLNKGNLEKAYQQAKDEADTLQKNGEQYRADLVKQTYMQEKFLPAVEVVVNYTSPDELLNNRTALAELDKRALGHGKMSGFTGAYVRQAYANSLGRVEQLSSPEATTMLRRINGLMDTGQIVVAKGYAKRLEKKMREGKLLLAPQDYDAIKALV